MYSASEPVSQVEVMKPNGAAAALRDDPVGREDLRPGSRAETSTANVCVADGSSSRKATAVS